MKKSLVDQKYILVFDIDNTINNKDDVGDFQLIDEFKILHDVVSETSNFEIAYNTTRGIVRVLEILKPNQSKYFGSGIISALNGALIYDLNKSVVVRDAPISKESRNEIATWFGRHKNVSFAAVYSNTDIYGRVYLSNVEHVDEFYKKHAYSFNYDKSRCTSSIDVFSQWIKDTEIYMIEYKRNDIHDDSINAISNVEISFDGLSYITRAGVNKGTGLMSIKKFFGQNQNYIAVGDSETDLKMFQDDNKQNISVGLKLRNIDIKKHLNLSSPQEMCIYITDFVRRQAQYE